MAIPTQDVQVVSRTSTPISDAEYEALRHPSESSLREELSGVPERLDQLFASLPKSEADVTDVSEIAFVDRTNSEQIRNATFIHTDGTKIDAETIHFNSSPEVWVVRAKETVPGAPKYSVYSWHGMHVPCLQHLSAEGEILGGTETHYSHPAQDLLSNVYKCETVLEDIEIEKKITGIPQFRDSQIVDFVDQHSHELEDGVAPIISKLPLDIITASLGTNERVLLVGVGPYNRKDLTFYSDGELQVDAVREACPKLMQIHDILKQHGFLPILAAEVTGGSNVPFLSLYLHTEEAITMVDMGPVATETDRK